ncbi:MAG TPA: pyrroline-5-carboxylate reductase [Myxococcota bacterium]|nr:pyrroline-5-carboxylate reductase [Myxococcota bacterium]
MPATRALAGRRIGFVGGGAMAEALIGGLIAAGVPPALLAASDPDPGRCKLLAENFGIATHAENGEAVAGSDLVVLAVKPSVLESVLRALAVRDLARPLWISIAAGVPLAKLASLLPAGARIVRAMPNTPALVRAGATAIAPSAATHAADREAAAALFETVGVCWEAPNESLLDAVTGLSGSGPAYVFVFLEALGDAGVRMGLPRDAAYRLAFQTVLGAAKLAQETGRHPAALKDQVTSPGGTTIAGLERLEAGGFRAAVYEAVAAATRRSRELGGS